MKFCRSFLFLMFSGVPFLLTAEIRVTALLDRASGIYKTGDTILFKTSVSENGAPVKGRKIKYRLSHDGGFKEEGTFDSGEGSREFPVKAKFPGWYLASFAVLEQDGSVSRKRGESSRIGALADPERIRIAGREPADFDAFWNGVKRELSAVPIKARREEVPVPEHLKGKVRCFDLKVDCAGGMPVSGYLCMPAGKIAPKSLPAQVCFQGAGVWSSNKMFDGADRGINLEINAHGIENGRSRAYYDSLPLGGYMFRGKEDRNAMYYKGVVMRLLRALEYVKSLPEWNGKTLIVGGFSQGGAQALWAAGLDQDVTLCIATCPALCDLAGTAATPARRSGWSGYYDARRKSAETGKIAAAVSYYDCAFFARRIKAKTYMAAGFADEVCPPTSVYAVFNELKIRRKYMETDPASGHNGQLNPRGWRRAAFVVNNGRKN